MKKLMIGTVAVAATLVGCTTVSQNDGANDNLRPPVAKDKIHVSYEVSQNKVSAKDSMHCLFGFICWGSSATHECDQASGGCGLKAKVKDGAYANACDAGKCDQIAAPRYKVTIDDYFVYAHGTAEVSGYPAKITGVEVIDAVKHPEVGGTMPVCNGAASATGWGSFGTSAVRSAIGVIGF